MSSRIVIAHTDAAFGDELVAALAREGFEPSLYASPYAASDAVSADPDVWLLITKTRFGMGRQHGLSLALTLRARRPDLEVIFLAKSEFAGALSDYAPCLIWPRPLEEIVAAVREIAKSRGA